MIGNKNNKRYINHEICSTIGTKTILSSIDNYINETLSDVNDIQIECNKSQDFNHDVLLIPSIHICDNSMDLLHHKIDVLKASLNRYLFADEDFKSNIIRHDKLLSLVKTTPNKKYNSKLHYQYPANQFQELPTINEDFYDDEPE